MSKERPARNEEFDPTSLTHPTFPIEDLEEAGGKEAWEGIETKHRTERLRIVCKVLRTDIQELKAEIRALQIHEHGRNGALLVPAGSVPARKNLLIANSNDKKDWF